MPAVGVENAMLQVAGRVGPDIAYFTETEARHFDPISLGVVFAGLMLSSFITGLTTAAQDDAQALGRHTEGWLREHVRRLFRSNTPANMTPEDARTAVERATEKVQSSEIGHAQQDALRRYAEASGEALRSALLKEKLPPERARAVAAEVQAQALLLLVSSGAPG